MGIALLGPLLVEDGAVRLGTRDRIVISVLAMRPGHVFTAEQLADAIWSGATPPASWRKILQGCVVRLRKALGPDAIETSGRGYRLMVSSDAVDGTRFEQFVARGQELLELGESERASYTLGRALALWRGRPLAELEEWEPGSREAERLEELRLAAQEDWLAARLQAGHHREVLSEANTMASASPMRERRWQLLALALYRSGRQAEALGTLQRVRRMLAEELGLDPGPELDDLERAILQQDPGLLAEAAAAHASRECPYLGLTSYDVEDAEGFFGRDGDIVAGLERLDREGILAVVGPSGCGKSSLVRAGIAAALRRDGGTVAVISPGSRPMESVAPILRERPAPVLVVDQAEEIFVLCPDDAMREEFLDRLTEYADLAPVVMAWRADRLGDISSHRGLANLVERGLYVLTAMSPDELRAVVEGPARQAGLLVEPGLVDLLVREVEGEPGALPLLSHVLRETWLRRDGRTLTVDGYRESGGIRGAVAQSAEDVYSRIDPDHRQLLRDLLLRLVAPGAEGQPVRARLPRRLVVTDPAQDELIDLLVGSRLVTSDDGVIELAHEALARAWPRLQGWLDDDVEGRRILHHLSSVADAWDSLGRPDSELYRGMRLVQAVEWSRRPHPELTPTERTFLRASQRLAAMEERTAADRARHQARMVRRLRALLGAAAVLLVAALGAGSVAARQRSVADANASAAEENAATAAAAELAAVAGRAGARGLSTDDVDVSLLLAAAGARLDESPQTRANLLAALAQRPQLVGSTLDEGAGINGLGLSPDGSSLATYDRQSRVHLYDTSTWQVAAIFDPDETRTSRERVAPLAFSPDGRTLAVGMPLLRPNPVRLLDADTLRPVTVHLRGTTGPGSRVRDRALGLDYSADGRRLAATFHRLRIDPESDTWEVFASRVLVWDMADAHRPLLLRLTLPGRDSGFRDRPVVALSPDGRQVYTSKPLAAYDVESGRRLWRSAKAGYVMDASPDGRTLAVDADHDVRLLDAATGHLRRTLHGHDEDVLGLRFSADGELLASAAGDGLAIVWDAQTGAVREQLSVAETNVYGLVFSPDDRTLYTAGYDHAMRRWDLTGRSLYISRVVPPGEFGFGYVDLAPGAEAAAHLAEGTSMLDTTTGRLTRFSDLGVLGTWTHDGGQYVGIAEQRIEVWSPGGDLIRDSSDHPLPGTPIDVGLNGDDSRVIVAFRSGRVRTYDALTWEPVGTPLDVGEPVCCFSGLPDGHTAFALVGGAPNPKLDSFEYLNPPNSWALLDLDTGTIVKRHEFPFLHGGLGWALSPDGTRVAVGSADGEVAIIDLESGRPIRPLEVTHTRECCQLAWSPDGSSVVASSNDGTVSLWNGRSGELLGLVRIPEAIPSSVEFRDDGLTVSIVGYTDSVYLWDTSTETALEYACTLAGRNFTQEEWQTYFDDRPYIRTCPY